MTSFEVGDCVWSKMKGYPPWPGKIMNPPEEKKTKRSYVFFFGTENYAWISDKNIVLHSEHYLEKYGNKKGSVFLKALQKLLEETKNNPKYHESMRSSDKRDSCIDSKSVKVDNLLKIKIPEPVFNLQKIKQFPLKKEFPVKTVSQQKKHPKRHALTVLPTDLASSSKLDVDGTLSGSLFTEDDLYMPTLENLREIRKEKKLREMQPSRSPSPEMGFIERKYIERPNSPPIDLMHQSEFFRSKKIVPCQKTIGFLGLNKIGQALVKNLYYSGHRIVVWNHTPEECKLLAKKFNIRIAKTLADVIRVADIIFSYLPHSIIDDEDYVENSDFLKETEHLTIVGKGYVELTSMDPKVSHHFGSEIKLKGGHYLEAPICGSRKEAVEGTLVIMASGDSVLYEDCKSCFDAISKLNKFISAEIGMGAKHDIIYSMLTGTVYAAVAESLALVDANGLNSEHFKEILAASSMGSPNLLEKLTSMMTNDYTTDIALKHMQEQFNLGLALGDEVSQRTAIFATAKEIYKKCAAIKYGDHDVSAVFEGTKP